MIMVRRVLITGVETAQGRHSTSAGPVGVEAFAARSAAKFCAELSAFQPGLEGGEEAGRVGAVDQPMVIGQ